MRLSINCSNCLRNEDGIPHEKQETLMSILPQGEQLRRALTWIAQQTQDRPGTSLPRIIGDACLKFDLPPKDEEFLLHFYAGKELDNLSTSGKEQP